MELKFEKLEKSKMVGVRLTPKEFEEVERIAYYYHQSKSLIVETIFRHALSGAAEAIINKDVQQV